MANTSQRPRPGAQAADPFSTYMPDDLAGFADSLTDDELGIGGSNAPKESAIEGLGIDKEVEVKKRAREPRVKLDEARLLSDQGIPALRKRARVLKIKGKGHEFSDTYRLLSMYQLWLDDLFPKARFADALTMVEKEGHKTSMHKMRTEWINESKPQDIIAELDEFLGDTPADATAQPPASNTADAPTAAELESGLGSIPDDLFDEDELEEMMRAGAPGAPSNTGPRDSGRPSGIPDEDELDEMMAMASEMHGDLPDRPPPMREQPTGEPPMDDMDDMDDLDAFMEEAQRAA